MSRLSRVLMSTPQLNPEAKTERSEPFLEAAHPHPEGPRTSTRLRHGPFSALRTQVSHALHQPAQTVSSIGSVKAALTLCAPSALDLQVRGHLVRLRDHAGVQLFDRCWRSMATLGPQSPERVPLANLYASTMRVSEVDDENPEDVRRCIAVGRRALHLNSSCLAAEEQLAIVYSCMSEPAAEGQQWVDLTVAHAGIKPLCLNDHRAAPAKTPGQEALSADFFFAYWRTYHQHPSRRRQAAWALATYQRAPVDQRHCDKVLLGLHTGADRASGV